MKINGSIEVPDEAVAAFCRKWKITELALFGSVLREDFGPESDIDVPVRFDPEAHLRFSDMLQIEEEPKRLLGRDVDLIDRRSVEESKNWIRRRAILGSAKTVYVSG